MAWFEGLLPFGLAPMLILTMGIVAAAWELLHPIRPSEADLRLWTFADIHYRAYKRAVPEFEKKFGKKVELQLVHGVAVTSRLRAAFWADLDVPDLVEVEISSAGTFFRGPLEDVGFIDLTPWLKKTGYYDRIVKTRFAPYTSRGKIFGLPHDVHPVMLAYRRDVFEAEGVNASELDTWDKFIEAGIDGVSFGTNDLTMLILGIDRDDAAVQEIYDERNLAVLRALSHVIRICRKHGVTTSICGQAPSNYPEVVEFLVREGATSISVNPDKVVETRNLVAMIERKLMLDELRDLRERMDRLEKNAEKRVFKWSPELD